LSAKNRQGKGLNRQENDLWPQTVKQIHSRRQGKLISLAVLALKDDFLEGCLLRKLGLYFNLPKGQENVTTAKESSFLEGRQLSSKLVFLKVSNLQGHT